MLLVKIWCKKTGVWYRIRKQKKLLRNVWINKMPFTARQKANCVLWFAKLETDISWTSFSTRVSCSEDPELQVDYVMVSHIYLNDTFYGNWCGRSGPIMWPPNSPDLTPPEFFFGVLRRMMCIYSDPWTLTISKKRFAQRFKKLHLRCLLHHTWDAIFSRYELCRLRNGSHVEV